MSYEDDQDELIESANEISELQADNYQLQDELATSQAEVERLRAAANTVVHAAWVLESNDAILEAIERLQQVIAPDDEALGGEAVRLCGHESLQSECVTCLRAEVEWLRALESLVREYIAEYDTLVPDYALRMRYRIHLRAALKGKP